MMGFPHLSRFTGGQPGNFFPMVCWYTGELVHQVILGDSLGLLPRRFCCQLNASSWSSFLSVNSQVLKCVKSVLFGHFWSVVKSRTFFWDVHFGDEDFGLAPPPVTWDLRRLSRQRGASRDTSNGWHGLMMWITFIIIAPKHYTYEILWTVNNELPWITPASHHTSQLFRNHYTMIIPPCVRYCTAIVLLNIP